MEILIITGPPYSGKGTQCDILKDLCGYIHVSTGDRCRVEKLNKTHIGAIMSSYEENGELVPDSIMKDLFSLILDENISMSAKGIILDGYPRTIPQVDDLMQLVESKNLKINKVINIEVCKTDLLERAKKRAETSKRKDDTDTNIHIRRIDVLKNQHVQPLNI